MYLFNKTSLDENRKIEHIAYSEYLRRIFYLGKNFDHLKRKNENNYADTEDSDVKIVKFSPDEKFIVCGDELGSLKIFSLENFDLNYSFDVHNAPVTCLDFLFTNDMYLLATGSEDSFVHVFDFGDFSEERKIDSDICTLNDHETGSTITNIKFAMDKNQVKKLISSGSDFKIHFYQVNNNKTIELINTFVNFAFLT